MPGDLQANLAFNMANLGNMRLAVLIDADNAPRNCLRGVMAEIAIFGTPTIKRIYGDWTTPNLGGWKHSLLENAITPIQQYAYTTGKNSTDSAMIIDAMDILYSDRTDGFVLVSSDSDFTRLAIRLREAGMTVIGIGEKKTPSAFIAACNKFIYVENIREQYGDDNQKKEIAAAPEKHKKQDSKRPTIPDDIVDTIALSVADIADDDGFAFLGELGNLIQKKLPDFDPRTYGFSKLTPLIKSLDRFEVDIRQTSDPNIKHPYVRDRRAV